MLHTLQWDTVQLLHFALELLRQHSSQLWLPLAEVLEAEFGTAAVLPLRKLLDPDLTLVLMVAAPDRKPVRKKEGGGGGGGGEEEEEEEEKKTVRFFS